MRTDKMTGSVFVNDKQQNNIKMTMQNNNKMTVI